MGLDVHVECDKCGANDLSVCEKCYSKLSEENEELHKQLTEMHNKLEELKMKMKGMIKIIAGDDDED